MMLHLNLSGNESWQRGNPPTDITFENIKIEGVKMGLTAYGIKGSPMTLTLKNVDYTFHAEATEPAMFRVANCDEIKLENVKVSGFTGNSLIRAWSEGIKVTTDNLDCELGEADLIALADEEFVCKAI